MMNRVGEMESFLGPAGWLHDTMQELELELELESPRFADSLKVSRIVSLHLTLCTLQIHHPSQSFQRRYRYYMYYYSTN